MAETQVRVSDKNFPHTYVWFDLADGTTLQVFYNAERRLFVADVISADGHYGSEFVRTTVPTVKPAHEEPVTS